MPPRIFLLSPADCSGRRASLILRDGARGELARRVRREGASVGELFSFMSGLYFRGKLAYARTFSEAPPGLCGAMVITPHRGLLDAAHGIRLATLRAFARVPVDPSEPRYRRPLARTARALAAAAGPGCEFVLLGSVATSKYVELLDTELGGRLCFPAEFVGKGDMSRGALMLRCVKEGRQLTYVRAAGAARRLHAAAPAPAPARVPTVLDEGRPADRGRDGARGLYGNEDGWRGVRTIRLRGGDPE
ncbi:MAG TPA: hypothetical protein VJV23_03355 [Candidatus Polarisedimenticolia bacterium]|nr:hypothetical protein [Candidatus Polarisedimenticolia bacterium]